jgi:GT2 family glycosyltransferase
MKKIFILIVTFNRIEYLKKLLERLKYIKPIPQSILIVDNNSTDNTNAELVKLHYASNNNEDVIQENIVNNTKILYYRNSENSGGAGGFAKGFEILKKYDWDYLWIMDDDVLPDEKCLENLLKYQTEEVKITIPNRTTEGFLEQICTSINLKNPFKIFMHKKTICDINKVDKKIKVVDMAFEGPLMNREIVNLVGSPNEEYFLQYDDTDYATRAKQYTDIEWIKDAHLYKQIIPSKDNKKYMNWKDYYAYRNDIIYCRKYGRNCLVKNITPIFLWMNLSVKALLKMKFRNFKVINKAFIDGLKGNSGKTVKPGEL